MEIKAGKLFDKDGKEIPMDFVYQAKKKGIEFHKVVNAYYYQDEANEESSKSDDEEHRSSQAVEA
jgi:hypothetical protein